MMVLTQARRQSIKQLALHRAASVAKYSSSQLLSINDINDDPAEYVKTYSREYKQQIAFDLTILETELNFLGSVKGMDRQDRTRLVYELIDRDCDHVLSVLELAEALRILNGAENVQEVMPLAAMALENAGCKGGLGPEEFSKFLESLAPTLETNYLDMCLRVLQQVVSAETGGSILDDAVSSLIDLSSPSIDMADVKDAVVEARMVLLFDLLADHRTGAVDIKKFVKHVLRFHGDIYELPKEIHLMLEQNSRRSRSLKYEDFCQLLLNVVATCPQRHVDFHVVANAMTLSVCRRKEVVNKQLKGMFEQSLVSDSTAVDSEHVSDQDLARGRLDRLYGIFDADHDGTVGLEELAIGLRSFQQSKDVEIALDATLEAFRHCDANNDGCLSKEEFTSLLASFAAASDTDLHALVDFMLIHAVLNESTQEDKEYISKMLNKKDRRSSTLFQRAGEMAGRMLGDAQWQLDTVFELNAELE